MSSLKAKETFAKYAFLIAAGISICAVILICAFIFSGGFPPMAKIGFAKFLFGKSWKPNQEIFGILPMIAGSVIVTVFALLIGVPIALLTAVFLSRFCPAKIYGLFESGVKLLAGIPSVVFGFFGLTVIVPCVRNIFGGSGTSILSASLVLAIMILPTITSVCESAIRAVPKAYLEGSLALGACKERGVFFVELLAAKSGITAAIVLGLGRAIGETMAVVMVCGNQAIMPRGLTKGVRTMTANIVLEMGYAADLHRGALIATAAVLFIFILIINVTCAAMKRKAS